jgi:putative ATP-binding cassette transporter
MQGIVYQYCGDDAATADSREFTLGPLDLTLRAGELVFVVGGNGSGKTTLLKLLAGLYEPEDGRLLWNGTPVTAANQAAYRQNFSVVFAEPYLFAHLLGLSDGTIDAQARTYLARLRLAHVVGVANGELSKTALSHGQRKRLALLTAYLEDRPVYLFDEWAASQDPEFRAVFYHQLLPELKARGKLVVVITHDDRYFDVADRLLTLDFGQLVASAPRAAVLV